MWQLSDKSLKRIREDHGRVSDTGCPCLSLVSDLGCKMTLTGLFSYVGYTWLDGTFMVDGIDRNALYSATNIGVAIAYPPAASARIFFCTTPAERSYLRTDDQCGQILWNIRVSSEKIACGPEGTWSRLLCKTTQLGASSAVFTVIGALVQGQQINSLIVLKMAGISVVGNVSLPILISAIDIIYLGCVNGCDSISCFDTGYYVFDTPCFRTGGAPVAELDMQREPLIVNDNSIPNALIFSSPDSPSATEQTNEQEITNPMVTVPSATSNNPLFARFKLMWF